MSCDYEEQSTVPVAWSEIDELRSMVVKLQEQKYFFEQMKRQQEPLQDAVPTEQLPCTIYISLNPFSVAKKAQLTTTICPSREVTTAVSSVIPVSTVNTQTVAVMSSTTSAQSSVTAAVDASSTLKRVNTMWLNPPHKSQKSFLQTPLTPPKKIG